MGELVLPVFLRESDVDAVLNIETTSFAAPWSRRLIVEELRHQDSWNLGAEYVSPDKTTAMLVAYLSFRIMIDEMHVMRMAVSVQWRGRGVGARLFSNGLDIAAQNGATRSLVDVRVTNDAAVRFYTRFGFQVIGVRRNYYPETGDDAWVMQKTLN